LLSSLIRQSISYHKSIGASDRQSELMPLWNEEDVRVEDLENLLKSILKHVRYLYNNNYYIILFSKNDVPEC